VSLALAYMRQARVDWVVYERLKGDTLVADCARIHALRLACEKTGKSLRAAAGEDLTDLRGCWDILPSPGLLLWSQAVPLLGHVRCTLPRRVTTWNHDAAPGSVRITQHPLRSSHRTLAVVVNLISRSRPIRQDVVARRLDWRRWLTNLRAVATDIESIIPRSGYNGPNAEYPWLDETGDDAIVVAPATYGFERAMSTYGTQAWSTFCHSMQELALNPRWAGSFNVDLGAL